MVHSYTAPLALTIYTELLVLNCYALNYQAYTTTKLALTKNWRTDCDLGSCSSHWCWAPHSPNTTWSLPVAIFGTHTVPTPMAGIEVLLAPVPDTTDQVQVHPCSHSSCWQQIHSCWSPSNSYLVLAAQRERTENDITQRHSW